MTFHEIAAKYGEEAAIDAGIAADPEWGPEEMDMSGARPAAEVLPDLVESYRRSLRLRETDGAAGRLRCVGWGSALSPHPNLPPQGEGILSNERP
jgi:hypothetical protein